MRNLNPKQHDTGTRLATQSHADVPFPSATKEIGDVCTQTKVSSIKLKRVSTLQEKQYLAKQQTRKVLSTKSHEYSPLWRINSPFIPLLIFSFILQR